MISGSKPHVGLRLRSFREQLGWSLRTLAERCGLSINAISRIERGENSPTISSLSKLAEALAVPITDFFSERDNHLVAHVRKGQGEKVSLGGIAAENLGQGRLSQQMEAFLITIDPHYPATPGSRPSTELVTHPGDEFIYCLAGEIDYLIGDEVYPLYRGDSLLLQGKLPHTWATRGSQPATLLLVFQAALNNSEARQRHLAEV